MKAVQFDRLGSPDVLRLAELPEPHAGPGQVRIAVRAAGVNPVSGRFSMPVAHVWPLTQLAEAHRVSESGHVRGKLVVVPDGAEGVPPAM
jgi:NADPH:quinone reductase-like Zn-dependent oxidoreductase